MSRGKKQIEGQLSFDFCLDARNYVVQANTLIGGKQALKLNSAKLIRSAIMQVVGGDEELKPYIITVNELSELLNVPASNIYRDIDDITDDIISNPHISLIFTFCYPGNFYKAYCPSFFYFTDKYRIADNIVCYIIYIPVNITCRHIQQLRQLIDGDNVRL